MLIPLVAFFYERPGAPVTDLQLGELRRWFWRASFSYRFSGNPQRNIRRDIEEAMKLRRGEDSELSAIPAAVDETFFLNNTFSIRTVASKTFILLLAQQRPRSFLSGELVNLERVLAEANRAEYHHCYPRAALERRGEPRPRINALANFAIINRSENREISDKEPSEYRRDMGDKSRKSLRVRSFRRASLTMTTTAFA